MAPNLTTLKHLLAQNVEDFTKSLDERLDEDERRNQRRSLKLRRRKAVTLVEELSIRTQKVQPLMKKLEQISGRMTELEKEVERLRLDPRSCREDLSNAEKELHDLMQMTLEEPAGLRKRVELVEK